MLAVFISRIKFSKIVFAVWNFMQSMKCYLENNFCRSLHAFKINRIGLFYVKLNSRKWENSLCVFQRNSPKYSNDQRGKLNWNWLKFYCERNTRLCAITAPSYKQLNKLWWKTWKKPGLQRDSNLWPPRYQCDALPTELWSHTLGARSISWVRISCEEWNDVYYIWNDLYLYCGWRWN